MITVTIMGVVLGLAVPAVTRIQLRAKNMKAKADMEMIAAAVYKQLSDTGKWPGGIVKTAWGGYEYSLAHGYSGMASNPVVGSATLFGNNWRGPYLEKLPTDPWGTAYWFDPDYCIYRPNGSLIRFTKAIVCWGPNRRGRTGVPPANGKCIWGGLNDDGDNIIVELKPR